MIYRHTVCVLGLQPRPSQLNFKKRQAGWKPVWLRFLSLFCTHRPI